jgi:hypothetical protein
MQRFSILSRIAAIGIFTPDPHPGADSDFHGGKPR